MSLQMAMFPPDSEWVPPSEFPDLSGAKQIAIDLETRDPDLMKRGPGWPVNNGEVVGYAVAVDGWCAYYPIGHTGGGNLDRRLVENWMKKVCATDADKVFHNAQYDVGWLRAHGIEVNGRIIDTMVVASLLDENRRSFSLNSVAYDYLDKVKSEKDLIAAAREFGLDPKAEMWKLPAMHVGPYAQTDAELTLELWNFFKVKVGQEGLQEIVDLELALLPCLVDMTSRGVRVDLDAAAKTRDALIRREKNVVSEIKKLVGNHVEIWAAKSLADAFDKLSVSYPRTTTGAPSFTKAFLTAHEHPLAKMVVDARALNKIQGTFISSIMKHVGDDGRIHGHINQIRSDDGGTVSGRISMNNPNLQQIPARDPELGPMIRSLFLPEEGEEWASIDFSQQEPRILVHYASVFGKSRSLPLRGVEEFVDGYRNDPTMDFHTMVADMAQISRKQAKTINLGMMYGMGAKKMADQLDIPLEEAKELINQYHQRVPFVKMLMRGVTDRLNDKGSFGAIRSLKGRKCRFDLWEPDSFEMNKALPYHEAVRQYGQTTRLKRAYTYKALNRLIQASAADMTKQAMVDVYRTGKIPLIQIHDELAVSVTGKKEAQSIANLMTNAIDLDVPSRCDIEIGANWGEAE
jgi:DNA polymerase I-like protein with 3'-5' exonuclease and polymerase domains